MLIGCNAPEVALFCRGELWENQGAVLRVLQKAGAIKWNWFSISKPLKPVKTLRLISLQKKKNTYTSVSPTWGAKPTTGCGARSTCLWVHRNLFWQLSRDGNVRGSGMSHATTASPKPSFGASWRVDDAIVSRGNAGWTTSKSGHPCPGKNCLQGPSAEKTGR